jgi:uncharacterized protein (DUF2252 family)
MIDVPRAIQTFNAGRDPERLAMKLAKMRTDPFIFLRGTCHLFYAQLPRSELFARAPLTWVCGDLHLENFGSYKADNRLVYFDMNDFDEAALAPCTWELVRFLASIRLGAASLAVNRAESIALCHAFCDAYAAALAAGKARWVERETATGLVKDLLDSLGQRTRPQFLDGRSVKKGKKRSLLLDGRKALPASAAQREEVTAFMDRFAADQEQPGFFRVQDVARRIAGTGSLGVDRYIILVEGKGSPDGNYLLDLKEALPSALAPQLGPQPCHWDSEAARVVGVERRMQAMSMAFLQPVRLGGKSYVLRGLQASEDRVALDRWDGKLRRLEETMASMGEVVAWDQLRSSGRNGSAIADELIAFGADRQWPNALIDAAEHCAEQATADWQRYAAAYDDGFFR